MRRGSALVFAACLLLVGSALGGCLARTPSTPGPAESRVSASTTTPAQTAPILPTAAAASAATSEDRTNPASPTESRQPANGCRAELAADVIDALRSARGYRYRSEGFVYREVFDPDRLATPSTERVAVAFEGAYAAPDRSLLRYLDGAPELEPEETRQIGRDLWLKTVEGWQELPDAAEPERANLLAGIVADAGEGWTVDDRERSGAPGGPACFLVARVPLPGEGERSVLVGVDPKAPFPSIVQVTVTDAFDPAGSRHDSDLTYLIAADASESIEQPGSR
ncbi:MAG TPA: hypothetical protein VGQ47_02900 [Candidatus Limnocylindrales bacterium]|jgi:hypothetical protein|nr:hypothetical protein [Candidatus Limnocylindrales bacterium]